MKKILALTFALVLCLSMLVACGVDVEKVEETLKEEGYTVLSVSEKDFEKYLDDEEEVEKVASILVGMKGELSLTDADFEMVVIFEYKETADAKEAFKEADEEKEEGYAVERSGKFVIAGTTEAVELVK
ncbi:MAG: hypothetical protein IJW71_04010 [Clostridia bacterium]|nr:hypothetical protein [Clostridia bacterium]